MADVVAVRHLACQRSDGRPARGRACRVRAQRRRLRDVLAATSVRPRDAHPAAPMDGIATDDDLGAPQALGEARARDPLAQPGRPSLAPGRTRGWRVRARPATEPFLAAMHTLRARFVPDTVRERLVLQDLDAVLREALALDDRPYRVQLPREDTTDDQTGVPVLGYPGAPLTSAEEHQVGSTSTSCAPRGPRRLLGHPVTPPRRTQHDHRLHLYVGAPALEPRPHTWHATARASGVGSQTPRGRLPRACLRSRLPGDGPPCSPTTASSATAGWGCCPA